MPTLNETCCKFIRTTIQVDIQECPNLLMVSLPCRNKSETAQAEKGNQLSNFVSVEQKTTAPVYLWWRSQFSQDERSANLGSNKSFVVAFPAKRWNDSCFLMQSCDMKPALRLAIALPEQRAWDRSATPSLNPCMLSATDSPYSASFAIEIVCVCVCVRQETRVWVKT